MNPNTSMGAVAAIVTKLRLRDGADRAFSSWHARMATAAAAFPGFLSSDVVPVPGGGADWRIVQNFRTSGELQLWRRSEPHRLLLAEAKALLEGDGGAEPEQEEIRDFDSQSSVTEVVTTRVKVGQESAFCDWCARIQELQARFPGYRGIYLQPPPSEKQPYWTTLLRFATPAQLDAWLASEEREQLLRDSESFVESWRSRRLPTAFAGWFPQAETTATPPPGWKQTMLVLLVLFPIVMLELRYLMPLTATLNPALGTFIGNAISVSLVSWPMMPLAIRALSWWLWPERPRARWTSALGVLAVLGLYAIEIALLWNLF